MKAREINSPVIKQLIDETTAEELAKIDTEMTNNKEQTAVEKLLRLKEQLDSNPWQYNWIIERIDEIIDALNNEEDEMAKDVIIYNDTKRGWFIEGLKFMRDKIQRR